MKKKLFIIFVYMFIFMLTSGASVQALTECEDFNVTATKLTELDGVVQMSRRGNTWEELSITKYEADRNIFV